MLEEEIHECILILLCYKGLKRGEYVETRPECNIEGCYYARDKQKHQ